MRSLKQTDILTGSIPKQLLLFFLPIWFGTLFQQLYNTADTLIVGNFVGIAQSWGAHDPEAVDRQVHTALVLSVGLGALLTVLGFASATPMMRLMGTPEDVLGQAALYMRIYFVGMPAMMLYNFGAAILRSVGDTKRPLFDHCGRCKRHFESVLRHCVPSRRGGCCHCDGHFAGDFCGTCDHLPDENERFLPFGAA